MLGVVLHVVNSNYVTAINREFDYTPIPVHGSIGTRAVEGIKQGILKFYTSAQVLSEYSWENVNRRFYELYKEVVGL